MSISFEELRDKALSLGWNDMGVTKAQISAEDITAYQKWIAKGHQAQLHWMENDLRCYPDRLLPGAKSAIIFVSYYKQEKLPFCKDQGLIASYARGRDYHNVHRSRLKKYIAWLEEVLGQRDIARGFSDSKPILEKALAVQAGLGWFGKNTLLIHRRFGTFTLLSGLLTTVELPGEVTAPRLARCGSCTRCLDACPTQALISPYELDANRCLSNLLIESKGPVPAEFQDKNPGYLFGCDICQDACPHNKRTPLSLTEDFQPHKGLGPYLNQSSLLNFQQNPDGLNGSPLKRRGAEGLQLTFDSLRRENN